MQSFIKHSGRQQGCEDGGGALFVCHLPARVRHPFVQIADKHGIRLAGYLFAVATPLAGRRFFGAYPCIVSKVKQAHPLSLPISHGGVTHADRDK